MTGRAIETKKSLGQHWLQDKAALKAMADGAAIAPGDTVLEVGPGPGTLTDVLLSTGATVHAVEFDESLIPLLKKKYQGNNQLALYHGDILRFDLGRLPAGYKVVANIPYYLTSNLLRMLCEASHPFSQAALLMQKEVAERICAGPGDMNLLSVSVQLYADTALGRVVPANLFTPPPKVDSQILLLTHLTRPRFDVDARIFFRLVKAGFSERRKMLRSSLSGGLGISKQEAEALLMAAGLNPTLRAQALSLQEWRALYQAAIA